MLSFFINQLPEARLYLFFRYLTFLAILLPVFGGLCGWAAWRVSDRVESIKATKEQNKSLRLDAAEKKLKETELKLKEAQDSAETANKLATQLEILQQPRSLSEEQQKSIIEFLKDFPKQPVRVVTHTGEKEVMNFAKQILNTMEAAGYGSPNKEVECIIGPRVTTPNNESVSICYPNKEEVYNGLHVQNAFRRLNIPTAAIVSYGSMHLKKGEFAIVVTEKYP